MLWYIKSCFLYEDEQIKTVFEGTEKEVRDYLMKINALLEMGGAEKRCNYEPAETPVEYFTGLVNFIMDDIKQDINSLLFDIEIYKKNDLISTLKGAKKTLCETYKRLDKIKTEYACFLESEAKANESSN